jgi:DNA polymerase-1
MRKFFVAGESKQLIDADYSQIELRVLADLAGDEAMISAFNNGEDIHRTTAAQYSTSAGNGNAPASFKGKGG